MSDEEKRPDLRQGLPLDTVPEGRLVPARIGDAEVVVVRQGDEAKAFAAECTHLGAPLEEGIVEGGTIRCPWHHACFSLTDGRAVAAPAFTPLRQWPVAIEDGWLRLTSPSPTAAPPRPPAVPGSPGTIVIVGGGAGGFAAADRLRRDGYRGTLTVLSDDVDDPYDRTLLTKDVLAGQTKPDDAAISPESLRDLGVDLRTGTAVERLDRAARRVVLKSGEALPYDVLLLSPGAEPRRLRCPGADGPNVFTLRSLADCRAILDKAAEGGTAVVVGGSFIGTEAAASLRDRGLAVHLVSPETRPLAKVLGEALSDLVVATHREHGVGLHLGRQVAAITDRAVRLDDGTDLPCDLVVVGIGVSPRTALAEAAGLAVDDGILVDDHLRASDPFVYAVGDAARWPDPRSGERIRVEHWAVAERQGQVAAANMLGHDRRFDDVPFFWTKQFDVSVRYVGHAGPDDRITMEGRIEDRDARIDFESQGRRRAVATVGRDRESLAVEAEMEREIAPR